MKTSVLLLQHEISRYNAPIYELIAREVQLTVGYFKKDNAPGNYAYQKLKLATRTLGPFTLVRRLYRLCRSYDVVIFDPNPACPSFFLIPFVCRSTKTIPWTIGVRASYSRPYVLPFAKKGLYYRLMDCEFRQADAVVFYMQAPIDHWVTPRLPREKFFVAHNTVAVADEPIDWSLPRRSVLFVGSLYKEKRVEELLQAYLTAMGDKPAGERPTLDVVGDGDLRPALQQAVAEAGMTANVVFHGAVFDEQQLHRLFSRAQLCVSPGQAGLSVLKSMGYGVPFATRSDAITGGERLNIVNGENGFLYDTAQQLTDIIRLTVDQPARLLDMGRKARQYYEQHATPSHMAQGFLDAIEYAMKK